MGAKARKISGRIRQLVREGYPNGRGQAGAIAYHEARQRPDQLEQLERLPGRALFGLALFYAAVAGVAILAARAGR